MTGAAAPVASLRLGGLEPDQRQAFLRLLAAAGIDHEVVDGGPTGEEVRFPEAQRSTVHRLLLLAGSDDPPTTVPPALLAAAAAAATPGAVSGRPVRAGPPPSSLARRCAGAVVNATCYLLLMVVVLLGVVVVDTFGGGDRSSGDPAALALTLAPLVLPVFFVALVGGTPGMLLFGMRVLRADGGRPGWRRSLVRSLVVWGPYLVLAATPTLLGAGSSASAAAAWPATAWFALLAWSIHRGPEGRGWQDRAAGVRVVTVAVGPPGRGGFRAGSGRAR